LDKHVEPTREALAKGLLTEADIDASLRGVYRVMIKLGQLDPPEMVPYTKIKDGADPWTFPEHKSLVRLATQKSIVLLKNSNDALPLDKKKVNSIAVIGPYANQVLLDWYSGTPPYTVSALKGIRNKLNPAVPVVFVPDNKNNAAVDAARSADVAIVVVGNHPECDAGWAKCPVPSNGKEAVDRKSITLEQEELVEQVYAANPRTIMVLISSFPYAINWSQEHIPAILHMTHNSQELGNALADVIFGNVNPAGRLVHTWPRTEDQLPPLMDYNIRHGRTYMYFKGEPLYPFGYGLSYTTFKYSNLRISPSRLLKNGTTSVQVDVQNVGKRDGDEVVQLYVAYPKSALERAKKELRGFKRVTLQAGEKKTVSIPLDANGLAYWDKKSSRFVVEPTTVTVSVGASSADIKLSRNIKVE